MNGNMSLGKRVTVLEKGGGADIKKEISDLQDAVATVQDAVTTAQNEINALENKVNSGHVYSTEERVVGTWIDGRPVYERTVEISDNRVVSGSFEITVLNNIDFLVSQNVMFRDVYQNGAKFILSNYAPTISGWSQGSLIYVNSNNVLIFRFDGAGGGLEIFGVIQYIKTTDTVTP